MDDEMRLAVQLRHTLNIRDMQVHLSRRGCWHPNMVPCTCDCPMSDPRVAVKFTRLLASAAGFPARNPYL